MKASTLALIAVCCVGAATVPEAAALGYFEHRGLVRLHRYLHEQMQPEPRAFGLFGLGAAAQPPSGQPAQRHVPFGTFGFGGGGTPRTQATWGRHQLVASEGDAGTSPHGYGYGYGHGHGHGHQQPGRGQAAPQSWSRTEEPQGIEDRGNYLAAVYTLEQQARMGVDKLGHARPTHRGREPHRQRGSPMKATGLRETTGQRHATATATTGLGGSGGPGGLTTRTPTSPACPVEAHADSRARPTHTPAPTDQELQEQWEREATLEAIEAPRVGTNGEDRSAPSVREGTGAGRKDYLGAEAPKHPGGLLVGDPEARESKGRQAGAR